MFTNLVMNLTRLLFSAAIDDKEREAIKEAIVCSQSSVEIITFLK